MKINDRPLLSFISHALNPVVAVVVLILLAKIHNIHFAGKYLALTAVVFLLVLQLINGIHLESNSKQVLVARVVGIFLRWFTIIGLLSLIGYASKLSPTFDRHLLIQWSLITPFALVFVQLLVHFILHRFYFEKATLRKAVIIGVTDLSVALAERFQKQPILGVNCLGFFDDGHAPLLKEGQPLLGGLQDVCDFVKNEQVEVVYIALPVADHWLIYELLDTLRDTTVSIYYLPNIFMFDLIQARVVNVEGIPLVALCESPFEGINGTIKRLYDIILSILILFAISPLLIVIGLGVKLSSAGPVLFQQRRYGLNGEEINVYKFRSMTVCENGSEIQQATRNDRRITPLGAFLRKTSLDELPQFINVLQGRMSIVGPRPHAVAHNELYRTQIKGYMVRHKVKPGITGWAQVNGCRGETDAIEKMQERIEYDLDYLRNWSIGMDFLIILRTVSVVFSDKNAY
jgi:putative colanic acid biosynthesis UDP-glucose lipid carrier transferase